MDTDLYAYYLRQTAKFESRINRTKKIIYYVLTAASLVLLIKPDLIPVFSLLTRIAAVVGLLIFGLAAYAGGIEYYNKASGGRIVASTRKKFDCRTISQETLLSLFYDNNFEALAKAASAENQPLQLYIDEDKVGKVFYCQLMKYFSKSDFRAISEVKEIASPEYELFYHTIKAIK